MTIFTLDEVEKTFTNGEIEENILKGISLSLKEGEITALVGTSGSGKSTLLTIAAGLQPASDGEVLFDGNNLTTMSSEQVRKIRAKEFGFVFQFAHLVPFLTVEEQLMLMLEVSESTLSKREQKKEKMPTLLHYRVVKNSELPLLVRSFTNQKFFLLMNRRQAWIQNDPKI